MLKRDGSAVRREGKGDRCARVTRFWNSESRVIPNGVPCFFSRCDEHRHPEAGAFASCRPKDLSPAVWRARDAERDLLSAQTPNIIEPQAQLTHPHSANKILKSRKLFPVGPVTIASPKRAKKPCASLRRK